MSNIVLFVLTSHSQLGDSGKHTGFHFEEMTTPYYILKDAGFQVVLASVAGGKAPYDPGSYKEPMVENPESVQRFLKDEAAVNELNHTRSISELSSVSPEHFCAVYFPGGHGTMWDLPNNDLLTPLVGQFFNSGRPVAAVCHGIAGLIGAKNENGEAIVSGKKINCFTNAEEKAVELDKVVPFLLETQVRELGGEFQCSDLFEEHVAVDGNLITGQNPKSAAGVAQEILRQLRA